MVNIQYSFEFTAGTMRWGNWLKLLKAKRTFSSSSSSFCSSSIISDFPCCAARKLKKRRHFTRTSENWSCANTRIHRRRQPRQSRASTVANLHKERRERTRNCGRPRAVILMAENPSAEAPPESEVKKTNLLFAEPLKQQKHERTSSHRRL